MDNDLECRFLWIADGECRVWQDKDCIEAQTLKDTPCFGAQSESERPGPSAGWINQYPGIKGVAAGAFQNAVAKAFCAASGVMCSRAIDQMDRRLRLSS